MRLLGIDPGLSTGYCFTRFDMKAPRDKAWYFPETFGTIKLDYKVTRGKVHDVKYEKLMYWLDPLRLNFLELDGIVLENFILRPDPKGERKEQWTKLYTSEIVGMFRIAAFKSQTRLTLQEPSRKGVGETITSLKRTSDSDKSRHWYDAFNHTVAFAHKLRGIGGNGLAAQA